MKPKISIVSLGVRDLPRSLSFYRDGLGFPTHNYTEGDDYIMFALEGSWLSILPLEMALGELPPDGRTFSGIGLSHNEPSVEDVEATFRLALKAGATALKAPQKAPWGGYEASFADPDGYVWDIAYNPFTDLT